MHWLIAQDAAGAVQDIVDHAARQSDRWLFLATVVVLVIFCGLVIRYLIKDRESARVEHAGNLKSAYDLADQARRENVDTMKEMYGEQTKLSAQILVALQENNQLLRQTGDFLKEYSKLMEEMRRHIT